MSYSKIESLATSAYESARLIKLKDQSNLINDIVATIFHLWRENTKDI